MEYNTNYYPGQPGHPLPPVNSQQQMQQQQQQPPPSGQMMHAPMPPQNIRQAMPPGPPGHHQQMQIQQHLGHHPQQQHPNYHQIQAPHPHGPPVSHSGSPHPQQPQQQQQQQHHNHHQPGPPPSHQQSGLPQQHHMHPQSPHSHNGPPMHMQQQQPQINQMVRPTLGPSVLNHQQPGLQQPPPHHHQGFLGGGAIQHSNPHHYPQNQHHPHHQPQHHHQQQQHHHHHHQPQLVHHPPPPMAHHPHLQQSIGRLSPCPSICQTEFRIIELNRWLQSRPTSRHPINPHQPNNHYDESRWWEKFAFEFFEDDATLTLRIQDDKPVEYTIGRTLIPRFFRTYFDGGVTDLSFNLRNPKEFIHPHPQSPITLDCDQAFIVSLFRHPSGAANPGVVVHTEGHLILEFVSNNYDTLSIKSWKFLTKGCREYIDRSMTAMGPAVYLAEPITRQGLTKSTVSYLKMCMIMEPMQDLMLQHRQTKMDPRSCLRKYLYDRFKHNSVPDNRGATKNRRKRKSSAAPPMTGQAAQATTKKTKANMNNPIGNNSGLTNNLNMSPSGIPSFSLASQDVMVVGEPSMMGGDFGDDNERMITRLENTQYDPTASIPSNAEESDSMHASIVNESITSNGNNIDQNIENHAMSPSIIQQRQQQHAPPIPPPQGPPQQNQMESSPRLIESQQLPQRPPLQQQPPPQQQHPHNQNQLAIGQQAQHMQMSIQDQSHEAPVTDHMNQVNLIDRPDTLSQNEADQQQLPPSSDEYQGQRESEQQQQQQVSQENLAEEFAKHQQEPAHEETKINSIAETPDDSNLILGVNSVELIENNTGSVQTLNDESNSNSQLPCATASSTNSTMEQQQPVDNGVA